MVGWTFENASKLETATSASAKGLRPMHVRVSVRVHHVAFLHPGLDNGGRATMGDRSGRWKFAKKHQKQTTPPGLLQFGNKKGSWKNPKSSKNKPFGKKEEGGGKNNVAKKVRKDLENEGSPQDTSEISDIISAEAFRLSRDGIIQHHYALNQASQHPGSARKLGGKPNNPPAPQSNPNSSMLSPYSSSNPQEAARYYKECAERPKGYRRLVVSSAVPTSDVPIPSPPPPPTHKMSNYSTTSSQNKSTKKVPRSADPQLRRASTSTQSSDRTPTASTTWMFEKDTNADAKEKDKKKKYDDKNENLFDNVEYQYIGPPQTGPEFFQLLRHHGAATFGRYLPELACSVPNHSIGFEVRKSKSKRRCASTQPLVTEAPHIMWGDARDKMLSRIAKEGCPLIDSRKFEYVSNARLDETELSESLMVCGATLWVQNADEVEEGSVSSKSSPLKPHYTKTMVKAEYYGGKFVDGMKDGLSVGVKGLEKGTKGVVKGTKKVVKGTKDATKGMIEGGEKLLPIPHDRELGSTSSMTHAPSDERKPRRSKLKSMFNPKKVGNKLRRRTKRKSGDDGQSVDGSVASVGNDDYSVGSESESAAKELFADEDFDVNIGQDEAEKTPKDEFEDFTVVKPVPYVLLLDDIIDIRIVSFPDKDNVIAHFPISVASVMVQRSIDDRTDDPLKPSELTATLIQEPCAQQLRWGVELKVTLRAVEVKPQVPRVMPRPKDIIDEEMDKMKQRLVLLGKKPDEVRKNVQAKQEEIVKEENDLNGAIVAYGYGKGENNGAGQKEVRLRQMFYCEREHGAISRKMKRRTLLTDDEKEMMNDAKIDPSSLKRSYGEDERQKLLELLDVNFPGIEKEDTTDNEGDNTGSESSLAKASLATESGLAKASLAMAQSLDICLGELTAKPTVPGVQQQLRHTFPKGIRPPVTKNEAKEWCSQVAEELSSHVSSASATDATIKSSIAKVQSIITKSALGRRMEFEESAIDTKEEMKLDEDEIALSQTKSSDSQSDGLDSSKLVDWVTAVASQLEACAEELDDGQESIAYSETLDSIPPVEEGNPFDGLGGTDKSSGASIKASEMAKDFYRPKQVPSVDLSINPPIIHGQSSDPDDVMWESILSQKGEPKTSSFSNSGARIHNATSISTVKDALPRSHMSKTSRKSQIESLLNISKKSQSYQVNMQPTSFSATLVYLSFVVAVFAVGVAGLFQSYHFICSMCRNIWTH